MKRKIILSVLISLGFMQIGQVNVLAKGNEKVATNIESHDDKNLSIDRMENYTFDIDIKKEVIETVAGGLEIINKDLEWGDTLDYSNKPKSLILHHIEASRPGETIPVEDVHAWHLSNGWAGIGYNFYITKDGKIYRGRPENVVGAHAQGSNIGSLGIAVEGQYNSETMTNAQEDSLIKLGRYLRQKYNIEDIYGHGEVGATDCPGDNYPLDFIKNEIRKGSINSGNSYEWKQINGKWYCENIANNELVKSQWIKDGGYWYYLNSEGIMETGWQQIDGEWYYLQSNGAMHNSWWLELNNEWYYFDSSGVMLTGWQYIDNKCYYFSENGKMEKGWIYVDHQWYYMNNDGILETGWQHIDGKWYYLQSNGAMYNSWWLELNNEWYYFDNSGAMLTGWQEINRENYYFNQDGKMQTDWIKINNEWYYLAKDGSMQKDWILIDGTWYYTDNSGVMQIGWQYINGDWYYFNISGEMETGWQLISGDWYYLDGDGKMYANGTYTINGIEYKFNSSGVWIEN